MCVNPMLVRMCINSMLVLMCINSMLVQMCINSMLVQMCINSMLVQMCTTEHKFECAPPKIFILLYPHELLNKINMVDSWSRITLSDLKWRKWAYDVQSGACIPRLSPGIKMKFHNQKKICDFELTCALKYIQKLTWVSEYLLQVPYPLSFDFRIVLLKDFVHLSCV